MSASARKAKRRKQVVAAIADGEEATPRTQIAQFVAAADIQSTVKPKPRQQPRKQPAGRQVRTPSRKRARPNLSQRTAHSLLKEVVQRDPQIEMVGSHRKVTQTIPESTLPQSILKKSSKKFTSVTKLPTDQGSRKSKLRSVSFRDEQLNVPLIDFNISVDSGADNSAQWKPNRQRGEASQSKSPDVNLSISVGSEPDNITHWLPNREETVTVEADSPAVDLGGSYVGTEPRDTGIGQIESYVETVAAHTEVGGEKSDSEEEGDEDLEEEQGDKEGQVTSRGSRKSVKQRKLVPLSSTFVKELMMHFSKRKVTKEAVDLTLDLVDKFYDQLIDDLESYCLHAKRKTVEKADFELYLRRIREIHNKKSLDALVLDHLPMEYRTELLSLPLKKQ